MKRFAPIILAIALCACSSTQSTIEDGPVVSTPPQWIEYCKTYPSDAAC